MRDLPVPATIDEVQRASALLVELAGPLVETWVHQPLASFAAASRRSARLHFFRSIAGEECDFVVELGRRRPHRGEDGPDALVVRRGIVALPMSSFLGGQRA